MLFSEIIKKKVSDRALSASEIHTFVDGLSDNKLPPEQISALCMAIMFNGMDAQETGCLIRELAESGDIIDWSHEELAGPLVDKHSTGGVGDKTSFAVASIMAACGAYVPMISGRGLGHTGGTLDKLESIPGYTVTTDIASFKRVVKNVGCAIIGQTAELAPADGRLYAIRDITGTVESIPLICASILSKKYASGNSALVMDIKSGNGSFMVSLDNSRRLARTMIDSAAEINLKTIALITDMSEILGRTAGNALEVRESLSYLKNEQRNPRLDEVTKAICAQMILTARLESDTELARQRVEFAIASGKAAEIFGRMVHHLGGPADFMETPDKYLPSAAVVAPVYSAEAGVVDRVDVRAIGNMVVSLGGGRHNVNDIVDHSVGLSDVAAVGESVGKDRPLAILHAANQESFEQASATLRSAYHLAESANDSRPAVIECIS